VFSILLRACETMPGGGSLSVETGPARDGREVEIAVTDSGPALAPEQLARVFEPDFTDTAGAGLGLAQAHAIAVRHGGRLEVTSQPGRGTRVALRLPAPPPADEGVGR
jgi:two-component system NtrC family sensor kinase